MDDITSEGIITSFLFKFGLHTISVVADLEVAGPGKRTLSTNSCHYTGKYKMTVPMPYYETGPNAHSSFCFSNSKFHSIENPASIQNMETHGPLHAWKQPLLLLAPVLKISLSAIDDITVVLHSPQQIPPPPLQINHSDQVKSELTQLNTSGCLA